MLLHSVESLPIIIFRKAYVNGCVRKSTNEPGGGILNVQKFIIAKKVVQVSLMAN